MNLLYSFKIAISNLLATKMRSFLTILGVIIGVASVIIIMAIGRSAQQLIIDEIQGVGSNLVGVMPGASDDEGPPASVYGVSITTLVYDDLEALRNGKRVPEVEDGAGYVTGTESVSNEGTEMALSFIGTTASYIDVESTKVAEGRFLEKEEETNLARVAVLGSKAADDLFGAEDPLGKKIEINDHNFTVIGVFEDRGSAALGGSSQDESVVIPLKTAQKLILGINHVASIRLKVKSADLIDSAKANVATVLRERHNIDDPIDDDFTVRDQASMIETITQVTDVLRYFLLAVGTVSLAVGGVGIMNIMLIAVSQRVREVGLRKAIGARNRDVLSQFLVESVAVSFTGGFIGIVIGILVSFLVSVGVSAFGYNWQFLISLQSIIVATLVSIAIGIVFGLYPARKAAKISPMEALRYE